MPVAPRVLSPLRTQGPQSSQNPGFSALSTQGTQSSQQHPESSVFLAPRILSPSTQGPQLSAGCLEAVGHTCL